MLNAKRLTTNAKNNIKGDQKNYFRFEKLDVWHEARDFVSLVYKITEGFPTKEQFGLINQIRRAAVSICLNIAEGSTKGSDADLKRFLRMSQGSLHEVITAFYIAMDQTFITVEKFKEVYDFSLKLNAMLNSFIKALSNKRYALSN